MDRETAGMITKTREISRRNAGKLITLLMLLATGTMATTTNVYYVNANSTNPQSPYNDPGTAAKHIQTAVDLAQADLVPGTTECTVLVADGTYTLTAPITLSKGITLRSVNGRDVTTIDGGYPASTNRCITITDCSANVSGHNVIMAPHSHLYFDAAEATTPIEKVYAFEPIPPGLTPAQTSRILGAQAQLWTDEHPSEAEIDRLVYPRACAVAETVWSETSRRDWTDFSRRLRIHAQRLTALDINIETKE